MATIIVVEGNKLTTHERDIFTWFLVAYPVLVLLTFTWLVARHSSKLYAPQDFKNQAHWIEMQQQVGAAIVATTNVSPNGDSMQLHDDPIDSAKDAANQAEKKKRGKEANQGSAQG
jgi:hypothetical protein